MTSKDRRPVAIPRRSTPYALRLGAAAGLLLAAGLLAKAAEAQHGPHEHGVGQLNLAWDGEELEIELIAPGVDIVGFEHPAESSEDKRAVAAAIERLSEAARLFRFPSAAGCALEEAEVESSQMEEEHDHDHAEHEDDHGHAEHEEEHDHAEHGDEHDHAEHGHEAADEEGEPHAEFHAHYHFRCAQPEALSHLDVAYFEAFPAARELEVQMVTPQGQDAQELTAEDTRLNF